MNQNQYNLFKDKLLQLMKNVNDQTNILQNQINLLNEHMSSFDQSTSSPNCLEMQHRGRCSTVDCTRMHTFAKNDRISPLTLDDTNTFPSNYQSKNRFDNIEDEKHSNIEAENPIQIDFDYYDSETEEQDDQTNTKTNFNPNSKTNTNTNTYTNSNVYANGSVYTNANTNTLKNDKSFDTNNHSRNTVIRQSQCLLDKSEYDIVKPPKLSTGHKSFLERNFVDLNSSQTGDADPFSDHNDATNIMNPHDFRMMNHYQPKFCLKGSTMQKLLQTHKTSIQRVGDYGNFIFTCLKDSNGDLMYFVQNGQFWFNDPHEGCRRDVNCSMLWALLHMFVLDYFEKHQNDKNSTQSYGLLTDLRSITRDDFCKLVADKYQAEGVS